MMRHIQKYQVIYMQSINMRNSCKSIGKSFTRQLPSCYNHISTCYNWCRTNNYTATKTLIHPSYSAVHDCKDIAKPPVNHITFFPLDVSLRDGLGEGRGGDYLVFWPEIWSIPNFPNRAWWQLAREPAVCTRSCVRLYPSLQLPWRKVHECCVRRLGCEEWCKLSVSVNTASKTFLG